VGSGQISIEEFGKLDLRAGKVLACERIPKSDKLLKLTIDLGEGTPRTIASGVAKAYAPEELVGKTVAVVANLPKKPLRGVESHGMVLFAEGGKRGFVAVEFGEDVPPGTKVK
jgi:methionyl-tRNA synthetase